MIYIYMIYNVGIFLVTFMSIAIAVSSETNGTQARRAIPAGSLVVLPALVKNVKQQEDVERLRFIGMY